MHASFCSSSSRWQGICVMISSALKMISDMERIGDQAADIAEIVKYMADREIPNAQHLKTYVRYLRHGPRHHAIWLPTALNAFVETERGSGSNKSCLDDDVVDELF